MNSLNFDEWMKTYERRWQGVNIQHKGTHICVIKEELGQNQVFIATCFFPTSVGWKIKGSVGFSCKTVVYKLFHLRCKNSYTHFICNSYVTLHHLTTDKINNGCNNLKIEAKITINITKMTLFIGVKCTMIFQMQ